ncbi:MAG: hypothetical protein KJ041_08380 [Gammaproteobacteria bacterium]|nr:hypothetical protein [Gammaproteobacteria bacterium]
MARVLYTMRAADGAASPGQMSALAERLPEAYFSLYPDTGHATFAEQPDRFTREVEAFARRAGAGKTP